MVRAPEDQDPELQPLLEKDSKSLQQLLPEIPFWIKNPDYDREQVTCDGRNCKKKS
ncbi:hypothetical protein ACS0TY_035608 [Phlomoides rotata]